MPSYLRQRHLCVLEALIVPVAGLLAGSGVILMILPLATVKFVIPVPIIGVIVRPVILGLGLAKSLGTVRIAANTATMCALNERVKHHE